MSTPRPAGFAEVPRPFVLRAEHLRGQWLAPGQTFSFTFHLFDLQRFDEPAFLQALTRMAESGIGPERTPCSLGSLSWQTHEFLLPAPEIAGSSRLELEFLTPLELRSSGDTLTSPEFPVLIARLRDRISALNFFYGEVSINIDFRRFTNIAQSVRLVSSNVTPANARRFSTRTGQWHPVNGFTGHAVYEGPWRAYESWLRVGEWTGVGKQTAFGKGAFRIVE